MSVKKFRLKILTDEAWSGSRLRRAHKLFSSVIWPSLRASSIFSWREWDILSLRNRCKRYKGQWWGWAVIPDTAPRQVWHCFILQSCRHYMSCLMDSTLCCMTYIFSPTSNASIIPQPMQPSMQSEVYRGTVGPHRGLWVQREGCMRCKTFLGKTFSDF